MGKLSISPPKIVFVNLNLQIHILLRSKFQGKTLVSVIWASKFCCVRNLSLSRLIGWFDFLVTPLLVVIVPHHQKFNVFTALSITGTIFISRFQYSMWKKILKTTQKQKCYETHNLDLLVYETMVSAPILVQIHVSKVQIPLEDLTMPNISKNERKRSRNKEVTAKRVLYDFLHDFLDFLQKSWSRISNLRNDMTVDRELRPRFRRITERR